MQPPNPNDPERLAAQTAEIKKIFFPDAATAPAVDNTFREEGQPMRRFFLRRLKDETGISRTGRVLEGVLTQSGKVITEWRPPHSTIGVYNTLAEFMLIHVDCHPSCNEVVWLDKESAP